MKRTDNSQEITAMVTIRWINTIQYVLDRPEQFGYHTRKELLLVLGSYDTHWPAFISGQRQASLANVIRMIRKLNVRADWLLLGRGSRFAVHETVHSKR